MNNDTRCRKYNITINNPIEHGYSHEKIKEILLTSNYIYFCMCDEVGAEGTYHTHIFVCFENAVYFSTLKKRFHTAHIEQAKGSSQENRDYIRKEGKYIDSDKKETNIIGTFEEDGEMPLDKKAKNKSVSEDVFDMLESGCTVVEIIKKHPSYATKAFSLEQARQTILEEKFKNVRREVETFYIYGETGTGKTRSVMDKYGYSNVYKITNYEHPFDGYKDESIILFDEYRSSLPIGDFLQYLDCYPCRLPARYHDKVACYTKIFIISNIPLNQQYKNIQIEQPKTYNALIRRISEITKFEFNDKQLPFATENVIQISELPCEYLLEI
ncbi:MAG: viral replication protein [Acutalibacteraceae bacterium]